MKSNRKRILTKLAAVLFLCAGAWCPLFLFSQADILIHSPKKDEIWLGTHEVRAQVLNIDTDAVKKVEFYLDTGDGIASLSIQIRFWVQSQEPYPQGVGPGHRLGA